MDRKKKKTIILLAMILLLVVANGAASAWNDKSEKKKEKEAEASKIYLTDASDITAYSYSDGSQNMSFAKVDDTWEYDEDNEIPMNQDTVQSTADAIRQMEAVRELENPDQLSDYGLDKPSYTIQFQDNDGVTTEILIGNGAGENYYATVGDSGKVYTISSGFQDYLQFDLTNLVQYDTVPSIGSGNLKSVTITENGTDTVYEEDDQVGELAGGFGALSLTDCANYHASAEELAEYGLDESQRITAKAVYTDSSDKEQTFTVYLGKTDDAGENRYVIVEGSDMVYRISETVAQNMISIEETGE